MKLFCIKVLHNDTRGIVFKGEINDFSDRILDQCNVFVTPGGIFGSEGNNYIRISLCSPVETLDRAIAQIKQGMK